MLKQCLLIKQKLLFQLYFTFYLFIWLLWPISQKAKGQWTIKAHFYKYIYGCW